MKTLKRLCALASLLSLMGCDPTGSNEGSLTNVSCPAGQTAWDFERFPTGATAESLSQLGGQLDGGRTVNQMIVRTARCVPESLEEVPVLTTVAKNFCDFRTDCSVDARRQEALNREVNKVWICGRGTLAITYSCTQSPDIVESTNDLRQARCLQHQRPEDVVACVPENCYGQTRRDATMQCVPDLIKPIEKREGVTFTLTSLTPKLRGPSSSEAYSPTGDPVRIVLNDESLYTMTGSVFTPDAVKPQQRLTLWIADKIPSSADAGVRTLDAFRCELLRLDLSRYPATAVATGGYRIDVSEQFVVPRNCSERLLPMRAMVFGAWAANGINRGTGRLPYDTKANRIVDDDNTSFDRNGFASQLRASYDLEGSAVVVAPGQSLEQTCLVKPLPFFFNQSTHVYDTFNYYAQNAISVRHKPGSREVDLSAIRVLPSTTLVAPIDASVRAMEIKLNKAGRASGVIPAELTIAMTGVSRAKWSALISSRKVTSVGEALVAKTFLSLNPPNGTTSMLLPVPDPMVKGADGLAVVDEAEGIALPSEGLRAYATSDIVETGTSIPVSVPFTSTFRNKIFSGKYALKPGMTQTYVLRFCTAAEVYADYKPQGSTTRSVDRIKLGYNPADGLAGQVFEPATDNCVRTNVFSLYGENIVVPISEPEVTDGQVDDLNPTSSGKAEMSGTFDVSTVRSCDVNTGACKTLLEQGMAGSASPISSSLFQVDSEEEEGDENTFASDFKLLGFNVLQQAEAKQAAPVSPVSIKFAITPNFAQIARAFKKPFPYLEIEGRKFTKTISGLSIQFEFKVPLRFGILQGDLIFGIGAGAGLGVEVEYEYNPRVEASCAQVTNDGSGTRVVMGCTGNLVLDAMPFLQAQETCNYMGGKLAEPRDAMSMSAVRALVGASEEIWVGAQVGNEYLDKSDCASAWNTDRCKVGHNTYLRWLSDAQNFQRSSSFGAFTSVGAPTSLNNVTVTAVALTAAKPVDSAVTLTQAQFKAEPLDKPHRAVCLREAATTGVAHKVGVGLGLGLSAGFSIGFCTPSADLGICLEGAVNVLTATLTPSVNFTQTNLKNGAGKRGSSSIISLQIDWGLNLLSGEIAVKFTSPFIEVSYTLLEFEGFKVAEGTLVEWQRTLYEDFQ